jgi:PPM family protein phosphatase
MSHHEDTLELPPVGPAGAGHDSTSVHVNVDLGALTHPGRVRENNEDHYLVARFERTMHTLATNIPGDQIPGHFAQAAYAMLVADGMGGAAGGEVASSEAIRRLMEIALDTPDWIMSLDEKALAEVLRRFGQRFRQVQQALVERAEDDSHLRGMGTTLTVGVSLGLDLVIGHVGDSRAYLCRNGTLRLLTRDHTMAQALADAGAIRQEDVPEHPMAHTLTNSLGSHEGEVRVELHHVRLAEGEQLLFATDGLTDLIDGETIAGVLGAPGAAAQACGRLVDLALAAGGHDNVTVILSRYRVSSTRH